MLIAFRSGKGCIWPGNAESAQISCLSNETQCQREREREQSEQDRNAARNAIHLLRTQTNAHTHQTRINRTTMNLAIAFYQSIVWRTEDFVPGVCVWWTLPQHDAIAKFDKCARTHAHWKFNANAVASHKHNKNAQRDINQRGTWGACAAAAATIVICAQACVNVSIGH